MLIGTIFLGKVNKLNGQWSETKFFILGVPLFPVSSMWVTSSGFRSRQGIPTELNTQSIIAGYARIYTLIAAVVCIWVGLNSYDAVGLLLFGSLCAAAWVYFFFIYGQSAGHEHAERQKFGSVTGLYILPHWIDYSHVYTIYERAELRYRSAFQTDWMQDLLGDTIDAQKLPLLYILSYLNYSMATTAENKTLADKAELLLQNSKKTKLA